MATPRRRRPDGFDVAASAASRPRTAPDAPAPAATARMRKRSSQSLRARTLSPPASSAPSSRPQTPPEEPRLGTVERPYYTAIRKGMSRPSTPFVVTPSPAGSPPAAFLPQRTSAEQASVSALALDAPPRPSADRGEFGARARAGAEYAAYTHPGAYAGGAGSLSMRRTGGSMSGEMELRIARAARESGEGVVFRPPPPPPPPAPRRGRVRRVLDALLGRRPKKG